MSSKGAVTDNAPVASNITIGRVWILVNGLRAVHPNLAEHQFIAGVRDGIIIHHLPLPFYLALARSSQLFKSKNIG
jgi:hypothetical protein